MLSTFSPEANAFKEAVSLLHDDLAYYGFTWNGEEKLPAEISARIKQFNAQKTLVEGFEKQQAELLQKKAAMEGEQTAENATLEQERTELTAAENALQAKQQARQEAYQDRKTADERHDLDAAKATFSTAMHHPTRRLVNITIFSNRCEKTQMWRTSSSSRETMIRRRIWKRRQAFWNC